jgi:hypothetical protein
MIEMARGVCASWAEGMVAVMSVKEGEDSYLFKIR